MMKFFSPFLQLFLLFSYNTLLSQVELEKGLIGHWPLNGNANDISGNNRNGIVVGNVKPAPDRIGKFDGAVELDGTGSYIYVQDNNGSLLPDKFSISVWFQTTSDNVQTVIGKILFNQNPVKEQVQMYINWPVTPGIGSVIVPKGAPCNQGHAFAESRAVTGRDLCKNRWYFMVVTFDDGEHKVYIDGALKASRKADFSQITTCIGNLQFGAWWNGDSQFFKGLLDDVRVYDRAINVLEVEALYAENNIRDRYDFSYRQDLCNVNEVSFFYNGPGNELVWDFEPGAKGTGRRPVHTFSKKGVQEVAMVVKYDNCKTNDTLIKKVNISSNYASLLAFRDTTVCDNQTVQLKPLVKENFCWASSDSIIDPSTLNPTVSVNRPSTFYFHHKQVGNNLVKNGDFSSGNTGFTSSYLYRSNNTTEGEYFVSWFPGNWNSALSPCTQPNGLQGNMLLVNGDPEPNRIVWQQEIDVKANTTYEFELKLTALFPVNPALLQFSINRIIVGDSIEALSTPCNWKNFNTLWNSGEAQKALISIINRNTAIQGNDFAIDDISFREINYAFDSVTVKIGNLKLKVIPDTIICSNNQIQLNANGADKYEWFPIIGLNNPKIPNPIAIVSQPVRYYVKGKTNSGCEGLDSVFIGIHQKPQLSVSKSNDVNCDIVSSQLSASGGVSYLWYPDSSLNEPSIPNPVATPKTNTLYRVRITDNYKCVYQDSIFVAFSDFKKLIVTNDTSICRNTELVLSAKGAEKFEWYPSNGLSNTGIADPLAFISNDITYFVKGTTANNCVVRDSVNLKALRPPNISLTPSDTLICDTATITLRATGGQRYLWSPVDLIDDPVSKSPRAIIKEPTVFTVEVTDVFGCISKDSLKVNWRPKTEFRISPEFSKICRGEELQIKVTGGNSYQWEPNSGISNPNGNFIIVRPTSNAVFKVTATDNECKSSVVLTSEVQIYNAPDLKITKSNDIDCNSISSQLTASGGVSYRWEPALGLSNPDIFNPIASPTESTTYFVTVIDSFGCSYKESIEIIFSGISGDLSRFQLPSAFTPNGDGLNDCFGISKWGTGVQILNFQIFNRWGQVVFKGNNSNICWDGNINGNLQPSGNYMYNLQAITPCGEVSRKGNLILIR